MSCWPFTSKLLNLNHRLLIRNELQEHWKFFQTSLFSVRNSLLNFLSASQSPYWCSRGLVNQYVIHNASVRAIFGQLWWEKKVVAVNWSAQCWQCTHLCKHWQNLLTHWGLVMAYSAIELSQHWSRLWLGAIRYQAITWINGNCFVHLTLTHKLFLQENTFENVVCKVAAIRSDLSVKGCIVQCQW